MPSPQFWLATVICSFVGHRLANRYQIPGLVGLGTGLGVCVLMEVDIWGGILEFILASFLALSPVEVFVLIFSLLYAGIGLAVAAFGKTTVLAYMKLSSVVFSISVVSVGLPKHGPRLLATGGVTSAFSQSAESGQAGGGLASQLASALRSGDRAEHTIGRVSADTPLYYLDDGRPKETAHHVAKGTWVRVIAQHRNRDGAVWLEVQAPDTDGRYSNQSDSGLLHESRLEDRTTVPRP